jgi:hypothetical protein
MRQPPRFLPDRPTTCNISDLLNQIVGFVDRNPDWAENPDNLTKMAIAYGILTQSSEPDMVTDEEYEFIISIHSTLKENMNNG